MNALKYFSNHLITTNKPKKTINVEVTKSQDSLSASNETFDTGASNTEKDHELSKCLLGTGDNFHCTSKKKSKETKECKERKESKQLIKKK